MSENHKQFADMLRLVAERLETGEVNAVACYANRLEPGTMSFGGMVGNPLITAGLIKQATLIGEMEMCRMFSDLRVQNENVEEWNMRTDQEKVR